MKTTLRKSTLRLFPAGPLGGWVWWVVMAGFLVFSDPTLRAERLDNIFAAIRMVETGGEANPAAAVGDGNRSFGPYQISKKYWLDAGAICEWDDVRKEKAAEKVMLAYWKRYCPTALRKGDAMVLARIHNGGPNGLKKMAATENYWRRVLTELNHLKAQAAPATRRTETTLASNR